MSGWIIALIVIAIILVLTIWVIGMYNSLIGMRNRVGNSWARWMCYSSSVRISFRISWRS